jgi:hypothetical protein
LPLALGAAEREAQVKRARARIVLNVMFFFIYLNDQKDIKD